jgi:predicted dehydrogenase
MTNHANLKVGIVGCGAITEITHLPIMLRHPMADVYGIVDINEERAKTMAEKFCLERYFTDYRKLYGNVDVAFIALPNNLHTEPTIDFLEKGVNVLCEKPMATSTTDCKKMIEADKKSKAKLMIAHNKRFMSNVILLKRMVENGALGKISEYKCDVGSKFRWPTMTGFYFKKKEAGGGALIDMGVHLIDLFLWLFGEIKGVEYQARDEMGKGVEDNVLATFEHNESIKGSLKLSRTEILENKFIIKGEAGWIKIDVFDTTFIEINTKFSKISSKMGPVCAHTKNNNSYRDQFTHFADCIRTNAEPLISGTDGMKAIKVVEDCYNQA